MERVTGEERGGTGRREVKNGDGGERKDGGSEAGEETSWLEREGGG